MDLIKIEGGAPLHGRVTASGAKNAALPLFAATLLTPGTFRLANVPDLRDIRTIVAILAAMGADVSDEGHGRYAVDTTNLTGDEAPYELVRTMRASVLALGPLLARQGHARVSLPGGCAIGQRPIDQHLKGIEALGAEIELAGGYVEVRAPKRLVGARVVMDLVTVTGVMNIMMAAATADGTTVIENAAREPEVTALADFMNAMGADVTGAGTPVITVKGVEKLHPADVTIVPDRIEAGTFMVGAAITGGDVTVERIEPDLVAALTDKLKKSGSTVTEGGDWVRVVAGPKILPVDITTAPFPGFATDMQAQFMALMTLADGASVVREKIFENRFMHVAELQRMGANISVSGDTATVKGVSHLSGAPVMASDLRASASLVLAGLAARGETVISRVYHLDRGYERMEAKLSALGAKIVRAKESA